MFLPGFLKRWLPALGLLVALDALAFSARAQLVAGQVVDRKTGAPLPQVAVRLDGQARGTSTDEAGRFQLALPVPGARLLFSRLGYETRALPANELGARVALDEQTYQIGEVVVSYTDARRLLVRKWKIDPATYASARVGLLKAAQQQGARTAQRLADNPEAIDWVLRHVRIILENDGTVKVKVAFITSRGEWQFDQQSRQLTVVQHGTDRTATDTVVELSAGRLVLRDADPAVPDAVYVPAE